ncbi:MAG: hypothetical protein PHE83_12370 [Opitutaceae bacterium]|nr:hypothetical protein [Opitutaceae bacterium]
MYNVTLVNLAADARSAAVNLERIERADVSDEELRRLLQDFCAIDAVENVTAAPEIRVQVRQESYLIRAGQGKLALYDVLHRDLPGRLLTVEEIMAELDGRAIAARGAAHLAPTQADTEGDAALEPAVSLSPARASPLRLIALGAVAGALLGGHILLWLSSRAEETPAGFSRMGAAEAAGLRAALAGVYMTGTQSGQHGIVLTTTGELRLFELRAVDAPRVVHATSVLGRVGPTLCLATDQPGGLITISDRDTWVYCGETYKRIP